MCYNIYQLVYKMLEKEQHQNQKGIITLNGGVS